MRVHGVTQTTETRELTAEADDAETARALVAEQVPEGFELLQVHNAMPRGGRVIATAVVRESATHCGPSSRRGSGCSTSSSRTDAARFGTARSGAAKLRGA